MIYISGTAEATNLKFGNQNSRSAYQISQRAGAHGHRDRLGKCGDERNAPAFQLHGHRPERLLCHVFEGSSTDEEAIVSQLLLPQTICTLP